MVMPHSTETPLDTATSGGAVLPTDTRATLRHSASSLAAYRRSHVLPQLQPQAPWLSLPWRSPRKPRPQLQARPPAVLTGKNNEERL